MYNAAVPPAVVAWMESEGIPLGPSDLSAWLAAAGLAIKGSYRVDEVARLLGLAERTIYDLIARGDIEAWRPSPIPGHRPKCATRIPFPSVVRQYRRAM